MNKKDYFTFVFKQSYIDISLILIIVVALVTGYTISGYIFELTNHNIIMHILLIFLCIFAQTALLGSTVLWWRREKVLCNIYDKIEHQLRYCYKPIIGVVMRLSVLQYPEQISNDVISFLRFIYADTNDTRDQVISKTVSSLKNSQREWDDDITNFGYHAKLDAMRSLLHRSDEVFEKLHERMQSLEFIKTPSSLR